MINDYLVFYHLSLSPLASINYPIYGPKCECGELNAEQKKKMKVQLCVSVYIFIISCFSGELSLMGERQLVSRYTEGI